MVVEAAPAAPFEMAEPDLLLEFLIVALDAPAQLGEIDQTMERDAFREVSRASIWSALPRLQATRSAAILVVGFARRLKSMRTQTRTRAKREDSRSAAPSRHLIVRQAYLR